MTRRVDDRNGIAELTPRERELLECYIELGRYKLVADAMSVSLSTTRNMAAVILKVLDVNSIGQACVLYDRSRR